MYRSLNQLHTAIIACRRCPRLVRWREQIAQEKTRRYVHDKYWGKPVPGFGDPMAHLLVVGLAPAAHGANRTGRMFTGDNSGHWLYRALYKAGFANQPTSTHRADGLTLRDCYITATLRCAPPDNKPKPLEITNCRPFMLTELDLLTNVRVIVGLGKIGFDAAVNAFRDSGRIAFTRRPPFAHCAVYTMSGLTFIASFHPSQQNTFTGKLTEPMFDKVFALASRHLHQSSQRRRRIR